MSDKDLSKITQGIDGLTVMIGDLAQLMSDGFVSLNSRMDRLEGRMNKLEERMDKLEKTSREHTAAIKDLTIRIEKIEAKFEGIDDDIKYLYGLVEKLKKDLKRGHLTEEETRSRLEEVEAIARQLSQKVGLKV